MSKYGKSSKELPIGDLLIHAPPGAGKTYFAATASKYFPEKFGTPAHLKDILFQPWDLGGLDGLTEAGIDVPIVDVRAMVAELGIIRTIKLVGKETRETLTSDTKILVVDTVSAIDNLLTTYWQDKMPDEKDSRRRYGNIGNGHAYFYDAMVELPVMRIWLCHSKSAIPVVDPSPSQKAVALAHQANPGKIQPSITGKSKDMYVAHSSMESTIRATPIPGQKRGPGAIKRVFLPYGDSMFEGKCRWQGSLDVEEEPHLGRIIEKIRKSGK